MGLFGRNPDQCNEDVRRQLVANARDSILLEDHVFSRRENWHTQRDQDLDPNYEPPDF